MESNSKPQMTDFTKHLKKLEKICRVCGNSTGNSKRYLKDSYKEELKVACGIYVEFDLHEVHPIYICNNCERQLYDVRYKDVKSDVSSIINLTPKVFRSHDDDCELCSKTRGRPVRQKIDRRKSVMSVVASPCQSKTKDPKIEMEINDQCSTSETEQAGNTGSSFCDSIPISDFVSQIKTKLSFLDKVGRKTFLREFVNFLEPEDISTLSYYIGNCVSAEVLQDSRSFSIMYRDLEALAHFDMSKWLKCRPESVVSFILGAGNCSCDIDEVPDKKLLAISRVLEQLYMVPSINFVSPISFLMNVSSYTIGGSKTVVDMFGSGCPGGKYKTVAEWIRNQGSVKATCPDIDLINVFDNEQVIGKSYSIKPANKVKISIITNKGFVPLTSIDLQKDPLLKPPCQVMNLSNIAAVDLSSSSNDNLKQKFEHVVKEMMDQKSERFTNMEKLHFDMLHHSVQEAIEFVVNDQRRHDNNFTDSVDEKNATDLADKTTVTCSSCGTVNRKRKLVCDGCKERDGLKNAKALKRSTQDRYSCSKNDPEPKFVKFMFDKTSDENAHAIEQIEESSSRYSHVEHNHKGKHEVVLTDPVFCNPNSFQTIAMVLRQIGVENGITKYGGKTRHWTFVCCDGLPFGICKTLKEEAVICTTQGCNRKFLRKADFHSHVQKDHKDIEECPYIYEFDWFYLRIGSGHYEMNLVKSFIELNWVPYFETLSELMGFETDAAKQYAKACKDHHKSWSLICIFHNAFLRELVTPYVRHCMLIEQRPNPKGFFQYMADDYSKKDRPNLKYLMDQVCRFCQGIINFRMAVRRNNADLLKCAKHMTKELFYVRSHPKYQNIELYDQIQDLMMPEKVRILNDSYCSITTSGNTSLGEGMDFVLEEKNKQLKSWIPKGVPTDATWQTVCRNSNVLEKVKQKTFSLLGIKRDQGAIRHLDLESGIKVYRAFIRSQKYIERVGSHISLSGLALDEQLVEFLNESTLKRNYRISRDILCEDIPENTTHRQPLPVTPEERFKIFGLESMTIPNLTTEIMKYIELIPDTLHQEFYKEQFTTDIKNAKGKRKEKYISFIQELKEVLDILSTRDADHDVVRNCMLIIVPNGWDS